MCSTVAGSRVAILWTIPKGYILLGVLSLVFVVVFSSAARKFIP